MTHQSEPKPFLTAEWRHLALLQYEVDRALLEPLVPLGTELDLWHGRSLVSVVGFRFLNTRLLDVTVPFHHDFDEVNLRFYVCRSLPAEAGPVRRAVVFIRELVPRRAIALVARWCYNEPYLAVPMRHTIDMDRALAGAPGRVAYEWRLRGRWQSLEAETEGSPAPLVPGSEAEFITEHYWGYTWQRDGSCLQYEVRHPPWRVWAVSRAELDCDAATLFGPGFADVLSRTPYSAFVADGSPVSVFRGRGLHD
jgi:uncharacterized protein YqjF (DUF2071 family)